jgi:hypothetical protein
MAQFRRPLASSLYSARSRKFIKKDFRGAALVEAAIVFIPLCIIVFGIIEYGFIFKDSLTLSSATRAGARAGSAQPKIAQSDFATYVSQATAKAANAASFKNGDTMWIYKAKDDGTPVGGPTCSSDCIIYTYSGGSWNGPSGPGWDIPNVNACLGGAPGANIDSIGVKLTLSHDAITGWFHNMQLHEKTVMKFEPTTTSCT